MADSKRMGRPPLDPAAAPSADLHLRLSARDFDAAARLAKAQRQSVQDLLRRELKRLLADNRCQDI